MEKNCSNCHYGQQEYNVNNAHCFDGCFIDHTHQNWKAYTNADAIRSMTYAQLAIERDLSWIEDRDITQRDFDVQKECFYLLKEWLEKRMDE